MTDFWTEVFNFAQATTARVGAQLMKDFGQVQADQKADGSLVTKADKWADREIRDAIASTFPSHGCLSEETQHIFPDTEWCWIVDPLDGTTNFTRGIPLWGISLGLLYRGTPVFGYLYFPPVNQSFHGFWHEQVTEGQRGTGAQGQEDAAINNLKAGAFMNHRPIHTSPDAPSNNHFFSLCARSTAVLQRPFPCKIRMLGVASYNFLAVASGAALGAVEATPKIWDLAAVWVIIQAAGGAWVPLGSEPLFPLQAGEDYGKRSLPTLVASRTELVSVFKPLVEFLGKR